MILKEFQVYVCQRYFSFELYSFCPIYILLGCSFRIARATFDVFKILKCDDLSTTTFWYYDRNVYSNNMSANCCSHLAIILLNICLLWGILTDKNVCVYPWIIIELVEIILQMIRLVYKVSISWADGVTIVWKINGWLITCCLLFGRTCMTRED